MEPYNAVVAATCIAVYALAYRSLRSPFFLLLGAAAAFLSGAQAALLVPDGGALSDLSLALCGAGMAAAALQLSGAFRLAGGGHD